MELECDAYNRQEADFRLWMRQWYGRQLADGWLNFGNFRVKSMSWLYRAG